MLMHAMVQTVSEERVPISDALFARLCHATPAEARELSAPLSEAERARLALFCNSRVHFRTIGRALASTCSAEALTLEGGQAGLSLHQQADLAPDTWGSEQRRGPSRTIKRSEE